MIENTSLAARALDITDTLPVGLERRAAASAAVALSTTRTPAAARKVLRDARLDDDVRAAALTLIDQLDTTEEN